MAPGESSEVGKGKKVAAPAPERVMSPAPPPSLTPQSTQPIQEPEEEEEEEADGEGDVKMHDITVENKVNLTQQAKVATPPKFKGETYKLKEFLAKMSIYINHNEDSFATETDKVMFAISYLEGSAFEFIETYLDDYNVNNTSDQRPDTRRMFSNFNYLVKVLKEVYGEPFEGEKATQKLMSLKMHKHYPEYLAGFMQLAPRVNMDDNALKAFFYKGLTEQLKDELMRFPKAKDLQSLKNRTMEIWVRLRERNMEKHHQSDYDRSLHQGQHNFHKKTAASWSQNTGTEGKKGGFKRNPNQGAQQGKTGKKEGNCHNCGKPGHWARECRGPKRQRQVAMAIRSKGPATGANRQPVEKRTVAVYQRHEYDEPDTTEDYSADDECEFTVQDCKERYCMYHAEEKQDIFEAKERAKGNGPCGKNLLNCHNVNCQVHMAVKHQRGLRGIEPFTGPTSPPPAYLVQEPQEECLTWVWHCTDMECVTHKWQKEAAEYWPQDSIDSDSLVRIDKDYCQLEDNLHYQVTPEQNACLAKPEHAELRWTQCEIGSCLFHVGDKIRFGYMASPYQHARTVEKFAFNTEQRKHWFQMLHHTRSLGDEPASTILTEREKKNKECTSTDAAHCTAYACETHKELKQQRGYYPENWTESGKPYVWDAEYAANPSNLHHNPGEALRRLEAKRDHLEIHWTNCIMGWCNTHKVKKLLNDYVPSARDIHIRKAYTEGLKEELKDLTLQLQGW